MVRRVYYSGPASREWDYSNNGATPEEDRLSTKQAAKLLGVTSVTLFRWFKKRKFPGGIESQEYDPDILFVGDNSQFMWPISVVGKIGALLKNPGGIAGKPRLPPAEGSFTHNWKNKEGLMAQLRQANPDIFFLSEAAKQIGCPTYTLSSWDKRKGGVPDGCSSEAVMVGLSKMRVWRRETINFILDHMRRDKEWHDKHGLTYFPRLPSSSYLYYRDTKPSVGVLVARDPLAPPPNRRREKELPNPGVYVERTPEQYAEYRRSLGLKPLPPSDNN